MKKTIIIITAIAITIFTAYFQRITGPSYPKKINTELGESKLFLNLTRSGESGIPCKITIKADDNINGVIIYKRFKTNGIFDTLNFVRNKEYLEAFLPSEPPAGKLQYYVSFTDGKQVKSFYENDNIIIRYKGKVPTLILILHIILMFLAMFFSNFTGLAALYKKVSTGYLMSITIGLLLIGGLVLGPIVQNYAFGEYWTGFPNGYDLTDNKILITFIIWLIAMMIYRKTNKYFFIIIASIIMLIVYLIPHSMFGSELNYETGKVVTGFVHSFLIN